VHFGGHRGGFGAANGGFYRPGNGGGFHAEAGVVHSGSGGGGAYTAYRGAGYIGSHGLHHPQWTGGYWHGVWWPRAGYGRGYPRFLPVLPAGCAVYWWGGVPYYYYDDVYYTYSGADSGYVVTDPPPVEGDFVESGADDADQPGEGAAPPPDNGDVFVYPSQGQSEEQARTDKEECSKWAVGQTGFDPAAAGSTGDPQDYRRAMIACLDARGYTAK
jgi:hypothetical protein